MADDAVAVLDHAGVDVGSRRRGIDGRRDQPGDVLCAIPTRVLSLTLACTACRNQPWRKELLERWMQTAQERGMGAMTSEAARWVMAPRSFRRLVPAFGWLGPLAMGRPAHAFVAQIRAILAADDDLAEQLHNDRRPDAGDRRQPGHPDPAWRQRGDRRSHPRCRAGRDLRCRARLHGRTRQHVQQDPQGVPATRQPAAGRCCRSAR